MSNEVGILTVARYLREGVGDGIRCFVNTKYGLREVDSFTGRPGAMQGVLKGRWHRVSLLKIVPLTVDVYLDTEVFLAKRNLAGIPRNEIIRIAERAASVTALPPSQRLCSSTLPMDVSHSCANISKIIEDEESFHPHFNVAGVIRGGDGEVITFP